jgi:hypothetical protein
MNEKNLTKRREVKEEEGDRKDDIDDLRTQRRKKRIQTAETQRPP